MASSTLLRVSGRMLGWSLTTRDTVLKETPASRAMSFMVTDAADLKSSSRRLSPRRRPAALQPASGYVPEPGSDQICSLVRRLTRPFRADSGCLRIPRPDPRNTAGGVELPPHHL